MSPNDGLARLREAITENLRVQIGTNSIKYVNVGNALADAKAKQNHVIFARRGCGKTLLLHSSNQSISDEIRVIYLNCEDFKRHSFPNVLIEILRSLFEKMYQNISGWFGKKKKLKASLKAIIDKLNDLQKKSRLSARRCSREIRSIFQY